MPHIQGPLILSNPPPNVNKFPHPQAKLRLLCHMQIKLPTELSVCDVGTVSKISDGQPEGFGFNTPPGRELKFSRPSFTTPSVDRDVKPLVKTLDVLSGDLKEPTHLSIRVG